MEEEIKVDFGELLEAGLKCCKGGRWKQTTQMFEINILQRTAELKRKIENKTFKPKPTKNFRIHERGKERLIKSHHITDRQFYKWYCNKYLKPATENLIMYRNSASQKGKGTDFAIDLFKQDLIYAYKVCGGNGFYVFVYDLSDYFNSIPHKNIIPEVGGYLTNLGKYWLRQYVNNFEGNFGVGIGGEPSQVISIAYPHRIDRMIACEPGVIKSGRYMDDGYGIAFDIGTARRVKDKFISACAELGLKVNDRHTRIYNMRTDTVVFLKKRTRITDDGKVIMKITRKNIKAEMRRLAYQKAMYDDGRMPLEHIECSIVSYKAYVSKYKSKKELEKIRAKYGALFGKEMLPNVLCA